MCRYYVQFRVEGYTKEQLRKRSDYNKYVYMYICISTYNTHIRIRSITLEYIVTLIA